MGQIGYFGERQQVIAPERIGGFPGVAVLVDAAQLDVEAGSGISFVFPDCGLDGTEPDFMYWLRIHFYFLLLLFMCGLSGELDLAGGLNVAHCTPGAEFPAVAARPCRDVWQAPGPGV